MYTHSLDVAFADTDMAGVVHFSRLLCYVEQAEHAWLQGLGFDLVVDEAWPRVALNVSFSAPVKFPTAVDIKLTLQKLGESSLTYDFSVEDGAGKTAASGSVTIARRNSFGGKYPFSDRERTVLERELG